MLQSFWTSVTNVPMFKSGEVEYFFRLIEIDFVSGIHLQKRWSFIYRYIKVQTFPLHLSSTINQVFKALYTIIMPLKNTHERHHHRLSVRARHIGCLLRVQTLTSLLLSECVKRRRRTWIWNRLNLYTCGADIYWTLKSPSFWTYQSHKSHNASVSYPTKHHSEQI